MPTDKSNKIRLGDSSEINETLKPVKIGELLSPIELSKKVVRLTPGITFMLGNSLEISSDDTEENTIKGSINVLGDFKVNGSAITTYSVGDGGLTTNDFTDDDHSKLNGIEAGAEVNVKSNWNESDSNADSFIQNKPNVQYTSAISTGNNGLVPATGSDGHFLAHNGAFSQIDYTDLSNKPQEFDNDNSGLVPNPGSTGTTTKFLREDGTFQVPAYIANTDVDVSVSNLDARLNQLTATTVTIGDATDVTIDFEGGIQIGQGAVFMTEPSVTTGAGQVVWSWKQGNKLDITLASGSQNITFDTAHPLGGCNLTLKLTQPSSGSAGTVGTWTATGGGYDIKWAGGSAPTLSTANNAIDILSFYFDGSTYFGVASLNFS